MEEIYQMLSSKEQFLNKKGFSLIEMIISISIICILISGLYSLMNFTKIIVNKGDDIDTALYNGRYAIEQIKSEIISADKVYSSLKFRNIDYYYPNNIGFVTMKKEIKFKSSKLDEVKYNYVTYYQKNDELIRIAYNTLDDSLFNANSFSGHNQICNGLIDFTNSNLDIENNVINLSINMAQGNECLLFETTMNLRCPIEY